VALFDATGHAVSTVDSLVRLRFAPDRHSPAGMRGTDTSSTAHLLAGLENHRPGLPADVLTAQLGEVLGLPADQIDRVRPINTLGLDSLTAVELRNRMGRRYGWNLALPRLLGGASVQDLTAEFAATSENGAPA
jgi:hypothetical protein